MNTNNTEYPDFSNTPDSYIIDDIDIALFDKWLISLGCKNSQTLLDFALTLAWEKYQNPRHIEVDRIIERCGFYFPILSIYAHNGKIYHENGENLIKGTTKAQGAAK
jgi:hypothetical protein